MSKVNFKKMYLISENRLKSMNAMSLAKTNINYDNNILNQKKRNYEGEISSNNKNSSFSLDEEVSPATTEENCKPGISFKAKPKIRFRKIYTRKYKITKARNENETSDNKSKSIHQTDNNEEKGYQPLEKKQKVQNQKKKINHSSIPYPPKTKTKWLKL